MLNRRALLATAGATLVAGSAPSFAQTKKTLRVVVVANRYHEADGLMAALCNRGWQKNSYLSIPYNISLVDWPRDSSDSPSQKPRCLIDVRKSPADKAPSATMEIWCIDDLAEPKGDSGAKVSAMDTIVSYSKAPDGVVAFGTAGYPGDSSDNGCATIGGTIFIHDAAKDVPGLQGGNWSWPGHMGALVSSKIPQSFFSNVLADQGMLKAIQDEMIAPKNLPANVLQLIAAADAVGVSSVNIPYAPGKKSPYCEIDTNAIGLARAAGATNITSVETTHGVIRSKWPDAPFIYVTAIPNRVCHFDDEAKNTYAQEFPSSHNAGVALKHVVPYFVSAIAQ